MSSVAPKLDNTLDPSPVWKECLNIIKDNVPFITYNTWFLPIVPVELIDTKLKVQVPNNFFVEWIEEHYKTLLSKTIIQVLGENGVLVYKVLNDSPEPETFVLTKQEKPGLLSPWFPRERLKICKLFVRHAVF